MPIAVHKNACANLLEVIMSKQTAGSAGSPVIHPRAAGIDI